MKIVNHTLIRREFFDLAVRFEFSQSSAGNEEVPGGERPKVRSSENARFCYKAFSHRSYRCAVLFSWEALMGIIFERLST